MTVEVVGHTNVIARIEAEKPPVSLFLGPSSVGKWTVAEYLRGVWRIDESDTLRIENLTVQAARDLVDFALYAGSAFRRLAIVRLDRASPGALNVLLKTLEEGHDGTDFILIADETPIATITTRAVSYRFGFLSPGNVADVLRARNFREDDAARYAEMSGGQVSRALSVVNSKDVLHTVRVAVRGLREMDPAVLESTAKEWSDEHTSLLAQWCRETLTGRPRIFSVEEFIESRRVPLRVLEALSENVRPRLLVRSSLMAVARGT